MSGRSVHCTCLALLAFLLVGTLGCGEAVKPSGAVQGTVTFDGKPVPDATIQFQSPETGAAGAARVDKEGKYKLDAPLATGKYAVSITPYEDVPPAGTAPAPKKPKARPDIPQTYRNAGTSGLNLIVSTGTNTFDAKMTAGK